MSNQIAGDPVDFWPVAREQVLGSATDEYALPGVVDQGEYSSRYTGIATPSAVVPAAYDESPTRTTRTESGWNELARGVAVVDAVWLGVTVCDCVGVVVGEFVELMEAPEEIDADAEDVKEVEDVGVGDWEAVTDGEGVADMGEM